MTIVVGDNTNNGVKQETLLWRAVEVGILRGAQATKQSHHFILISCN